MRTIDDFNFRNRKALIRVDFNVPLDGDFNVTDDTRLKAAIPTIKKIIDEGGSAILMSHLGRPKTGPEEKFSLKHIIPDLSEKLGVTVQFANDCIGDEAIDKSKNLGAGQVLLLENVRFYKEEEKGDEEFASKLAKLGDIYVNDAFGTAHRAHASTTIVAKSFADKCCGYVMQQELENAKKVLGEPQRPFTAIMGGAKVSDKILIIERLMDVADNLIIGGGMSYTFSKAEGGNIGQSLLEEDKMPLTKELRAKAKEKGVNLILPVDTVIADDFNKDANKQTVKAGEIPDDWQGLDIGPETVKLFAETVEKSKTILWNGPMGVFEFPAFAVGTESIAKSVVKATENGGFSLIGGGDSASAINNLGFGDKVSYVSTGGGALLEYMEGKVLPGVAALEETED
ncbi:MAG: phosphoglycerate kinase [Flammeovirgaceae bacterium]|nr:phosphoglycerate kinase [Flammeovirgaceae bacterium]MBR09050.1 phosphoglycerate kinase [Rickettsiales bacterium]HCX23877.1 phosphoglycerate kinase [Cytophagales bacterium]|tara:strand:+ start:1144 stop:2340 length:1197 start_codon:yes stop_codon:yes gene_type:complete